jgi:hypothetical protein
MVLLDLLSGFAQVCRVPKHQAEYDKTDKGCTSAGYHHVQVIKGDRSHERLWCFYSIVGEHWASMVATAAAAVAVMTKETHWG